MVSEWRRLLLDPIMIPHTFPSQPAGSQPPIGTEGIHRNRDFEVGHPRLGSRRNWEESIGTGTSGNCEAGHPELGSHENWEESTLGGGHPFRNSLTLR